MARFKAQIRRRPTVLDLRDMNSTTLRAAEAAGYRTMVSLDTLRSVVNESVGAGALPPAVSWGDPTDTMVRWPTRAGWRTLIGRGGRVAT